MPNVIQQPDILGNILRGRQIRALGEERQAQREERNFLQQQRQRAQQKQAEKDFFTVMSHMDPANVDPADFQAAANWYVQRNPQDAGAVEEVQRLSNASPQELGQYVQQAHNALGIKPIAAKPDQYQPFGYGQMRNVRTGDIVDVPTAPRRGETLRSLPGGGFEIIRGDVEEGGLERPARTQVQKELLDATKTRGLITEIDQRYRPEFQQIGTRLNTKYIELKDKAGIDLSPEEAQLAEDFAQYQASAAQNLTTIMKELSGTAVTAAEEKRNSRWIPNPGTGVFDGDSPTTMRSKIDRFKQFQDRAIARLNFINRNGMSIQDIPLERMDSIIDKRGADLEKEIRKQMPDIRAGELDDAVKQKLAEEFGLVF